ncbi:MAG: hypothetical protein AAGA85_17430 [Bacteroidota bacterium]
MKKLIYLSVVLVSILTTRSYSQSSFTHLEYAPSIPVGNVTDFTGGFQWRGLGFGAGWFVQDGLTVGFQTGWNVFRDETDGIVSAVVETDNSNITLTGKQFRFINAVPILLTSRYYIEGSQVWPYIGAGVGTYFASRRTELGLRTFSEDSWHFGVAPEVGIVVPTYSESSFTLGLQYHQAFAAGDNDGIGYLAIKIGVGWGL